MDERYESIAREALNNLQENVPELKAKLEANFVNQINHWKQALDELSKDPNKKQEFQAANLRFQLFLLDLDSEYKDLLEKKLHQQSETIRSTNATITELKNEVKKPLIIEEKAATTTEEKNDDNNTTQGGKQSVEHHYSGHELQPYSLLSFAELRNNKQFIMRIQQLLQHIQSQHSALHYGVYDDGMAHRAKVLQEFLNHNYGSDLTLDGLIDKATLQVLMQMSEKQNRSIWEKLLDNPLPLMEFGRISTLPYVRGTVPVSTIREIPTPIEKTVDIEAEEISPIVNQTPTADTTPSDIAEQTTVPENTSFEPTIEETVETRTEMLTPIPATPVENKAPTKRMPRIPTQAKKTEEDVNGQRRKKKSNPTKK